MRTAGMRVSTASTCCTLARPKTSPSGASRTSVPGQNKCARNSTRSATTSKTRLAPSRCKIVQTESLKPATSLTCEFGHSRASSQRQLWKRRSASCLLTTFPKPCIAIQPRTSFSKRLASTPRSLKASVKS